MAPASALFLWLLTGHDVMRSTYSAEVRERAVRLVFEQRSAYESEWGCDLLERRQDGLHAGDGAQLGAAGRASDMLGSVQG